MKGRDCYGDAPKLRKEYCPHCEREQLCYHFGYKRGFLMCSVCRTFVAAWGEPEVRHA